MVVNRLAELMKEKAARDKHKVVLLEVARRTGIDVRTLYKWLSNEIGRYDRDVINALCKYFECQPGDLLVYIPDED